MMWQNKKVRIAIIASLVLLAIIAYRIYGNIQANNERASSVSQGRSVAVATAFPQRQSITPVMRFAGSLDPVWQADVAAKIDGRVEKVYVNEGDRVTAGTVLAHLEQTEQTANLLSAKGSLMDAQTTLEKAERELQHQDGHHPSRRHRYQCEDVHLGRALKSQTAQKAPRSS